MLYPSFDCFRQQLAAVAATSCRSAGTAPGRPPHALVVHPRPALIEASLSRIVAIAAAVVGTDMRYTLLSSDLILVHDHEQLV